MGHFLRGAVFAFATTCVLLAGHPAGAGTLDTVRQRGNLKCGVNTGLPGFSVLDSQGKWSGLDIDLCQAVAAAVLGDATKASYVPLTAAARFTAVQTGEVDMLVRNSTITLQRDTAIGLQYAGINFYDGQAVAVPKSLKIAKMEQLKGTTICIAQGTTHELTLADWFRGHKLDYKPVVYENQDRMYEAFFAGRCDAMTQDSSALAAAITSVSGHADDYLILPERISKEPLGPFVRHGDDEWLDVVRWSLMAMIEAEELGVTRANVDEKLKDTDPRIQRLLGVTPGNGKALGLDEKWVYAIVKQVGNYADSYDRNVGKASALKLERGPNALWTAGGLMYAIPLR
jgi:general L-amino acid transport system substrate-binding protein